MSKAKKKHKNEITIAIKFGCIQKVTFNRKSARLVVHEYDLEGISDLSDIKIDENDMEYVEEIYDND